MERHRQSRALDAFRKLQSITGLTLDEIAAAAELPVEKMRGFEAGRMRLKPRDQARVFAVLFGILSAKLRSLAPDFPDVPRAEELDRVLEQVTDPDVVEIPFDLLV